MGVQRLYQKLARSACILSFLLLFVSVWSVWSYCGTDHVNRVASQGALLNAVTYYNANRRAAVLTGVKSVVSSTKCKTAYPGWRNVGLNEVWVGSGAGCLKGGKTTVGACVNAAAGTTQAATASKVVSTWRGAGVCTQGFVNKTSASKVAWQGVASKTCTKEAVWGYGSSCSSCTCWSGACPVTGGSWNTAAGANDWVSANAGNTQPAVFVQVEQLGVPCVEGTNAPASTKWVWGLDSETRGCGTYGSDSVATSVVDTVSLNSWLVQSGVVVSASLGTASSVAGVNANLVVRRQVQTTCSAACRNFVFDTNVLVGSVGVWQSMKVLAWVVGWGALTSWLLLLYVVLVKKGNATQKDYTMVCGWTLLVGLVVVVLLWVLVTDVTANVTGPNANAVSAEAAGCVVDKNWSPVLSAWNASVNMDSLHSWLGWLTGFLVFQWVMTFMVSLSVCRELGKCVGGQGEYQDVGQDDEEDDEDYDDVDGQDEYDL